MGTRESETNSKTLLDKVELPVKEIVELRERQRRSEEKLELLEKENVELRESLRRTEGSAELRNRQCQEERLKRIRLERALRKWRRRWGNTLNGSPTLVISTPAVHRRIHPITPPRYPPPSGPDIDDTNGPTWLSSFEANLRNLLAQGDQDLEVIIAALKEHGLRQVKQWRPTKLEIVRNKSKIIKWILKPANVHKFKDTDLIYTASTKKSVWLDLVNNLYPNLDAHSRKKLVAYLGNMSKGASFFGGFVTAVVRIHNRICCQCGQQG